MPIEVPPGDAQALVLVVADNVKRLRDRKGFSLSEVAARAGIGKSTLSMLEAGRGNPSIETLWSVASALGVPFGQLIEPPQPKVRVVRRSEGIRVDAESADLHAWLLYSSNREVSFELYTLGANPGAHHGAGPHIEGSIEHLLVTQGRFRAGPEGELVELGPGDLATFPGDVPHRYEALDEDSAAVLVMEYR